MKDLEVIKELMKELIKKMEYGEEDFNERLGRKKPEVAMLEVEGKMPMEEEMPEEVMEEKMPEMGMDDDDDMMEEDPDEKFKKRIMRMRG